VHRQAELSADGEQRRAQIGAVGIGGRDVADVRAAEEGVVAARRAIDELVAPILPTLRAQVPRGYGPLVGVIETDESYGVVLPLCSALLPAVNDALTAILGQGTFTAIARRWMSADLARLPVLG
jgi:ABC-type amino acid transport substrate-binding protein